MTETEAKSLPEVTQSLWFERHWSSVYEAFKDGKIDQKYLQKVWFIDKLSVLACLARVCKG